MRTAVDDTVIGYPMSDSDVTPFRFNIPRNTAQFDHRDTCPSELSCNDWSVDRSSFATCLDPALISDHMKQNRHDN